MRSLSYSIANNIIPAVRISQKNQNSPNVVVFLARQHPCETVGSFIAEKIMKLLSNPDETCQQLLSLFDFVIIPMVNPDGVIHGMSRANMAGMDLNRQWGENILKVILDLRRSSPLKRLKFSSISSIFRRHRRSSTSSICTAMARSSP